MLIRLCKQCGKKIETGRNKYCAGSCFRNSERAYGRRHRATFSPERRRAANLVQTAISQKQLVKQPCEICGVRGAQAHHDDYAAPLDVRWLCRSHHKQHHLKFGPGLNAFLTA